MDARAFIQTVEVWVRDATGFRYESGLHGPHHTYAELTRCTHLDHGAGLQGAVAMCGRAKLWSPLGVKFVRAPEARATGLHAALGLPSMRDGRCDAVTVIMCGPKEQTSGAIEIWDRSANPGTFGRSAAYYGNLQCFDGASQHFQFGENMGLPGQSAQRGQPLLVSDLQTSSLFLRRSAARRAGLHAGLSLPIFAASQAEQVVTLLSSVETPLAQGMELWAPRGRAELELVDASYTIAARHLRREGSRLVARGEGAVGRAFETGLPVVSELTEVPRLSPKRPRVPTQLEGILAIPLLREGQVERVVSLIL